MNGPRQEFIEAMPASSHVLYNDNDRFCTAWLTELIKAHHLPEGQIDTRPIEQLQPQDCAPVSHFFAGIGGWPYALQLAGWPANAPVWTGSCPCQPFSAAGKRLGAADKRHLWPAWFRLIRECRPERIFSEQVASAVGHGWLDGVFADLEAEGYTCGAVVLGAHSVGAPHIRQRLFWMAHTKGGERRLPILAGRPRQADSDFERGSETQRMAHAEQWPAERPRLQLDEPSRAGDGGDAGWLGDSESTAARSGHKLCPRQSNTGKNGGLGDADSARSQGWLIGGSGAGERITGTAGMGFWYTYDLIPCADGKSRRVEPGTLPLAHGVPARVGRLRGYGNAIVPQVAAAFVVAAMEVLHGRG